MGMAWWIFLMVVAAASAWSLIGAVRDGRIMLVRDWGFDRKAEPFEFWFLAACQLIVVIGVVWVLGSGWSPFM